MTRILINASVLQRGGGVQVGVSFLRTALSERTDVEWFAAVSPAVEHELSRFESINAESVRVIHERPAKSQSARRRLLQMEQEIDADCVLTIFGPAYVRFQSPHLMGIADGWVTHSGLRAFRSLNSPREWATTAFRSVYKAFWYRFADAWWVEAECSRRGLMRRLRLPGEKIAVIPNSCSAEYSHANEETAFPDLNATLRVLTFSTPSPHKNLFIIPRIARELKLSDPRRKYKFIVTLPQDSTCWKTIKRLAAQLGVSDRIENSGPIDVADGPNLYRQADVLLMPSLLETFSAVYPEAMAMGLPIVTTNLGFARDICGKTAMYYSPEDPRDAARRLKQLANNATLWHELVSLGKRRLASQPSHAERFHRIREILLKWAAVRKTGQTSHHQQAA